MFSYMAQHPEFSELFSKAMDSVEVLIGDSFSSDFDWLRVDRLIDIGGSRGSKSLAILKRHSKIKAVVIDHEHVISTASNYWHDRESSSVLSRISYQVGDVLESVPAVSKESKDIYLLSAVLHVFDDNSCIHALTNIARAISNKNERIAILELIIDEQKPDLASTTFDMLMFMGTSGRERTLKEWKILFSKSGVILEEVVKLRSYGKIMVLRKI